MDGCCIITGKQKSIRKLHNVIKKCYPNSSLLGNKRGKLKRKHTQTHKTYRSPPPENEARVVDMYLDISHQHHHCGHSCEHQSHCENSQPVVTLFRYSRGCLRRSLQFLYQSGLSCRQWHLCQKTTIVGYIYESTYINRITY